jgi:hypothetical protein
MSDQPDDATGRKVVNLPDGKRIDIPEPLRRTPHCYRAGRNTPQGFRRVGGIGARVVDGLMDDDSECGLCFSPEGHHSRSCPRRKRVDTPS